MKALYLRAPNDFEVLERADPVLGADEALVRIRWSGICATDVATIQGLSPVAVYPTTPGHEFVGTVEFVPAGSDFKQGDWVTIYPTQGCGKCPACAANRANLCLSFRVFGVHRDGGSFAEMMAVPTSHLMAVPPELQNETGALIEPVAVAVHACRRAGVAAGDKRRIAVIGAGVIGTLIAQVARAWGAQDIVVADRLESRRETCSELGLSRFVHAANRVRLLDGLVADGLLDLVFDNACTAETISAAIEALTPGGAIVLLGFPHGNDALPINYAPAYRREVSFLLSRNYAREDFEEAARLLVSGRIDSRRMVTGTWPLSSFSQAYTALQHEPERHLKVMISV